MCSSLMDTICKDVVDPAPYFESCKEDVCFYNGHPNSLCSSMAAYYRECTRRGVHINWRTEDLCPISCSLGLLFRIIQYVCLKFGFSNPSKNYQSAIA